MKRELAKQNANSLFKCQLCGLRVKQVVKHHLIPQMKNTHSQDYFVKMCKLVAERIPNEM